MKRRLFFLLIMGLPAGLFACDLCNCFLGINPQFNNNQAGLRFRVRYASGPHAHGGGGHHHGSVTYVNDTWTATEAYARYYFNPKWVGFLTVPFVYNWEHTHAGEYSEFSGMGDPLVMVQRQIFNKNMTDSTLGMRLFAGAGIKFPLGNSQMKYQNVTGDPHLVTGTGSWDGMLLASYLLKLKKIGFAADANFRIGTANRAGYRFSPRLNTTGTVFYQLGKTITLQPNAGYYMELAGRDTDSLVVQENTGGFTLFATAGLDLYMNRFSFTVNGQLPLVDAINGLQPITKFRAITSVAFTF